jgi:hypothetical protein
MRTPMDILDIMTELEATRAAQEDRYRLIKEAFARYCQAVLEAEKRAIAEFQGRGENRH